jgi:3'(2'), 5'-bisphosphate nucleotidase
MADAVLPAGASVAAVCALARRAGDEILSVYARDTDFDVSAKADASPLTEADRRAHALIDGGLRALTPTVPVLSEEGRAVSFDERQSWACFWLVDPLDGTREFISRNGEFTVNIALIRGERPVFGVIHVPVQETLYWGMPGHGAWREDAMGRREPIATRAAAPGGGATVVCSRSHRSPALEAYLASIDMTEALAVGSALKFCVVAEGRASLYPRFGPTMEWDTGAGQALVEAAGGRVVLAADPEQPLRYNKRCLRNDDFLVMG